MKKITVGIPAYKAHNFIVRCLYSIQILSIVNDIEVVIANDWPEDNYEYLKEIFPDLAIIILPCEKNTGAGLSRQRIIDYCKTEWLTFIDADDVFYSPESLLNLYNQVDNSVVVILGNIIEESLDGTAKSHGGKFILTWVFAKLYRVDFLRLTNIEFSSLRSAEDTEFVLKISLFTWNQKEKRKFIDDPIIIWKCNKLSITRSNINNDTPLYTFDLSVIGFVLATLNAIDFCKEKLEDDFIALYALESMIYLYTTCINCKEKAPLFYDLNIFNAKRFYNECFMCYNIKDVEKTFYEYCEPDNPKYSIDDFYMFLDYLKSLPYSGIDELYEIRKKLPVEVINNAKLSGILDESEVV